MIRRSILRLSLASGLPSPYPFLHFLGLRPSPLKPWGTAARFSVVAEGANVAVADIKIFKKKKKVANDHLAEEALAAWKSSQNPAPEVYYR